MKISLPEAVASFVNAEMQTTLDDTFGGGGDTKMTCCGHTIVGVFHGQVQWTTFLSIPFAA